MAENAKAILKKLRSHSCARNVKGMARFGINAHNTLGVSVPTLRKMAKKIGKNHALALTLWASRIHEARLLAGMIDESDKVTSAQMELWARQIESWDICDQVCMNLFDRTPYAYPKARAWSSRKQEFVKRAGFALMAVLAVHDKRASDKVFTRFLPLIERQSDDPRNFVKKAVNWALRQIGKRNPNLRRKAIQTAVSISGRNVSAARWIASDALRELKAGK